MWQPPEQQGDRWSPEPWQRGNGSDQLREQGAARHKPHWRPAGPATAAGRALAAALAVVVGAGFVLVYVSLAAQTSHQPTSAARLTPGAGSDPSTPTVTETATPAATATGAPPMAYLRVTQNQDLRFSCLTPKYNYDVTLLNTGGATVNWQISIPYTPLDVADGPRYPYWVGVGPGGDATPVTGGTLGAGKSTTFKMWPQGRYPCAGQTYHATIHAKAADGHVQPDLTLTYAGSGPDLYQHLVVNQNQTYTESCVNGATPPPSYTAAITDTGNERAFPEELPVETNNGSQYGTPSLQGQIYLTPGQTWIDAGQTVNITVSPQSWIGCAPGTYHFKIVFRGVDWQQDTQVLLFSDTIT